MSFGEKNKYKKEKNDNKTKERTNRGRICFSLVSHQSDLPDGFWFLSLSLISFSLLSPFSFNIILVKLNSIVKFNVHAKQKNYVHY